MSMRYIFFFQFIVLNETLHSFPVLHGKYALSISNVVNSWWFSVLWILLCAWCVIICSRWVTFLLLYSCFVRSWNSLFSLPCQLLTNICWTFDNLGQFKLLESLSQKEFFKCLSYAYHGKRVVLVSICLYPFPMYYIYLQTFKWSLEFQFCSRWIRNGIFFFLWYHGIKSCACQYMFISISHVLHILTDF